MEDRDKLKALDKLQAERDKFEAIIQKLQIKYRNFGYLLPQPLNIAVVVAVALILQALGLKALLAVTLAMLLATPVFYALYRRLML